VLKLKVADFFGEIALLSGKPRQATVKAVGAVSCLVMSRDAFTRLCGPLFEILRRNMATYTTMELPEELAPQGAGEEDEAQEEQEAEEEEETATPARPVRGRRNNVFVESAKVEDDWVPPNCEKTEDERGRLETYISKTALLSFLDTKACLPSSLLPPPPRILHPGTAASTAHEQGGGQDPDGGWFLLMPGARDCRERV
jgi:hypothetical protein